jgi:hypothetical protein
MQKLELEDSHAANTTLKTPGSGLGGLQCSRLLYLVPPIVTAKGRLPRIPLALGPDLNRRLLFRTDRAAPSSSTNLV